MRIFIGNLGNEIKASDLFNLFSGYGGVIWASVSKDDNNISRGFGYVSMQTSEAANNAITALNKKQFMQQFLFVSEALHSNKRAAIL